MLKTGPRAFAVVVAAVLSLWLSGFLAGFFWMLTGVTVIVGLIILLVTWRVGGSSQKQHDASMNRIPSIDDPAHGWIPDPKDYHFPDLPRLPEEAQREANREPVGE